MSGRLIRAGASPAPAAFAARLSAKARLLAETHLASRGDPARWRQPGWLWPLFASIPLGDR
ncbi:MAG: hypothetical protein ACEQR8_06880 [Cypionkella sp.]